MPSVYRSVQGFGDETITGSYVSNITDATIQDFIDILQSDAAEHSLMYAYACVYVQMLFICTSTCTPLSHELLYVF